MPARLLGLFAHPHEQSLLYDGTFARYAGAGADTLVVSVTPKDDCFEIVASFQPDVVVTFRPDGGYADPEHQAVHAAASAAFFRARRINPPSAYRPARLYQACWPARRQRRALSSLRARGFPVTLLAAVDGGSPDDAVTTVLDVRSELAGKVALVGAHLLPLGPSLDAIPRQSLEELCGWEFYVRVFPRPWVAGVVERELLPGLAFRSQLSPSIACAA